MHCLQIVHTQEAPQLAFQPHPCHQGGLDPDFLVKAGDIGMRWRRSGDIWQHEIAPSLQLAPEIRHGGQIDLPEAAFGRLAVACGPFVKHFGPSVIISLEHENAAFVSAGVTTNQFQHTFNSDIKITLHRDSLQAQIDDAFIFDHVIEQFDDRLAFIFQFMLSGLVLAQVKNERPARLHLEDAFERIEHQPFSGRCRAIFDERHGFPGAEHLEVTGSEDFAHAGESLDFIIILADHVLCQNPGQPFQFLVPDHIPEVIGSVFDHDAGRHMLKEFLQNALHLLGLQFGLLGLGDVAANSDQESAAVDDHQRL